MVADLSFYDAAVPPADPPETDGVCIYVSGDATHIWSVAEIGAQKARYRLPILVRSNPPGPGAAQDVASTLARLEAIGAPKGILVALDVESAADPGYVEGVYTGLKAAGYELIVYGSGSTVRGNQSADGLYWAADWNGVASLPSGDAMIQYRNLAAWDDDLALPSLPFWDAHPPKPVPAPPAVKPTVVQHGPYRHTAAAGATLGQIAAARNTTPAHLVQVTAGALSAADIEALAKLPLPAGWVFYTSNP